MKNKLTLSLLIYFLFTVSAFNQTASISDVDINGVDINTNGSESVNVYVNQYFWVDVELKNNSLNRILEGEGQGELVIWLDDYYDANDIISIDYSDYDSYTPCYIYDRKYPVNPADGGSDGKVTIYKASIDGFQQLWDRYDARRMKLYLKAPSTKQTLYFYVRGTFSDASWSIFSKSPSSSTFYDDQGHPVYRYQVNVIEPPDLVVYSADASPTTVNVGEKTSVDCTIANEGDETADFPTTQLKELRYFLSDDSQYDASDIPLGTTNLADFAAGESRYIDGGDVQIPTSTEAGTYYIIFYVDYSDDIDEHDEDNNTDYKKITVHKPIADLQVLYPNVDPTEISAGDNTSISCTVSNKGDAEANFPLTRLSELRYFLSTDRTFDNSDIQLGTTNLADFAAGESRYIDGGSVEIPEGTAPGTYYIIYYVDYVDDIVESDNENNYSTYIQVAVKNLAPTFNSLPNIEVNEGVGSSLNYKTLFDLDDYVSDYESSNSELNYSHNAPDEVNLRIDNGRVVEIWPDEDYFGIVTITISVADADNTVSQAFDLTITNINDAPTISGITDVAINEDAGNTLVHDLSDFSNDVDDDDLTYSVSSDEEWMHISIAGSRLYCNPDANEFGDDNITITVDDGNGESDSDNLNIEIIAVNDPPTATRVSPGTSTDYFVNEEITFKAQAEEFDDEIDFDRIEWSTSEDGFYTKDVRSHSGFINFWSNPANSEFKKSFGGSGTYTVRFQVFDDAEESDLVEWTVDITNQPPVFDPLDDKAIEEDCCIGFLAGPLELFDLDEGISDPDNSSDEITFYLGNSIPTEINLTIDPDNHKLKVEPLENFNGVFEIVVNATDEENVVSQSFILTINPKNDDPEIAGIPDFSLDEDCGYTYLCDLYDYATDIDGDILLYSVESASSWLNLTIIGSKLYCNPVTDAFGDESVTIEVTDPAGVTATDQFSLNIISVNDLPQLSRVIPDNETFELVQNTSLTLSATGSDSDGKIKSVEWLVDGVVVFEDTWTFAAAVKSSSFSHDAFAQIKDYVVTCKMFDKENGAGELSWTISVIAPPPGSIGVTIKNIDNTSVPYPGASGMAYLFNGSDQIIDTKTANDEGYVQFDNVDANGIYYVKAYHSAFSLTPFMPEYWGWVNNISVTPGEVTNIDVVREMPYLTGGVTIIANGMNVTGQAVPVGTQLNIFYSIHNPGMEAIPVRGLYLLDKDKLSGYDIELTSTQVTIEPGATEEISFAVVADELGNYYQSCGTESNTYGFVFEYTDGWAWSEQPVISIVEEQEPDILIVEFNPEQPDLAAGESFNTRYKISNLSSETKTGYLFLRTRSEAGAYNFLPDANGDYYTEIQLAPGTNWYERESFIPDEMSAGIYDLWLGITPTENVWGDYWSDYTANNLLVVEGGVSPNDLNWQLVSEYDYTILNNDISVRKYTDNSANTYLLVYENGRISNNPDLIELAIYYHLLVGMEIDLIGDIKMVDDWYEISNNWNQNLIEVNMEEYGDRLVSQTNTKIWVRYGATVGGVALAAAPVNAVPVVGQAAYGITVAGAAVGLGIKSLVDVMKAANNSILIDEFSNIERFEIFESRIFLGDNDVKDEIEYIESLVEFKNSIDNAIGILSFSSDAIYTAEKLHSGIRALSAAEKLTKVNYILAYVLDLGADQINKGIDYRIDENINEILLKKSIRDHQEHLSRLADIIRQKYQNIHENRFSYEMQLSELLELTALINYYHLVYYEGFKSQEVRISKLEEIENAEYSFKYIDEDFSSVVNESQSSKDVLNQYENMIADLQLSYKELIELIPLSYAEVNLDDFQNYNYLEVDYENSQISPVTVGGTTTQTIAIENKTQNSIILNSISSTSDLFNINLQDPLQISIAANSVVFVDIPVSVKSDYLDNSTENQLVFKIDGVTSEEQFTEYFKLNLILVPKIQIHSIIAEQSEIHPGEKLQIKYFVNSQKIGKIDIFLKNSNGQSTFIGQRDVFVGDEFYEHSFNIPTDFGCGFASLEFKDSEGNMYRSARLFGVVPHSIGEANLFDFSNVTIISREADREIAIRLKGALPNSELVIIEDISDPELEDFKSHNNLLLIGGPLANNLVADITDNKIDVSLEMFNSPGRSVNRTVLDPFYPYASKGNTAIILAGYDIEETYMAGLSLLSMIQENSFTKVANPLYNPGSNTYFDQELYATFATSTENAIIRYTTDGSEPTQSSTSGTSVTISETTTIKARAFKDGFEPSEVVTAVYTKNETVFGITGLLQNPDGQGIEDVQVYMNGSQSSSTITDATGSFEFIDLPAGGDYVVAPEFSNFSCTPEYFEFNNLDRDQDVLFTANQIPTISITNYNSGDEVSEQTITLQGVSADDGEIVKIEVKVNSGPWVSVNAPFDAWSATVTLETGQNIIAYRATDYSNIISEEEVLTLQLLIDNKAPIILSQSFYVDENPSSGHLLGKINAQDPDGDILSYSILSGNEDNAFRIDAKTGDLIVLNESKFNYEYQNIIEILVQVSDDSPTPLSAQNSVIVYINDQYEAPVVEDQEFFLNELVTNNTIIDRVLANDEDSNQELMYEIVEGASDVFGIDNTTGDVIVVDSSKLDFEGQPEYVLLIKVTDNSPEPLYSYATVTISLTDANEPPVIVNQNFNFSKYLLDKAFICTLEASDPDNDQSIMFSIDSGNNNNIFLLEESSGDLFLNDSTSLAALGLESALLKIRITDNGEPSLTDTAYIQLSIYDNHTPTIDYAEFNIEENLSAGVFVGKVNVSDVDQSQSFIYSVIEGDTEGAFKIGETNGVITVQNPLLLNFESTPEFSLLIKAQDNGVGGLYGEGTVKVILADINEAPKVDNQEFTVREDMLSGYVIDTIEVEHEDVGQELTFEIIGDESASLFSLDANSGIISVYDSNLLKSKLGERYSFLIKVSDDSPNLLNDNALVSIEVVAGNSKPMLNDTVYTISEAIGQSLVLDTLKAVDLDQDQNLSYSIVAGNEINIFSLEGKTGRLAINRYDKLNFEEQDVHRLTVVVEDDDLYNMTDTAIISIALSDFNEYYPVISDTILYIPEDYSDSVIYAIEFYDGDTKQSHSYRFISGNPEGMFDVDSIAGTLVLSKDNRFNFEIDTFYRLQLVIYDDTVNAYTDTCIIEVNILDVNDKPVFADKTLFILENPLNLSEIDSLEAIDEDTLQYLEYYFEDAAISEFLMIDAITDKLIIKDSIPFNYELNSQVCFNIIAKDNSLEEAADTAYYCISIEDVNEAPQVLADTFLVSKYSQNGTIFGFVNASDPDSSQSISYSIVGGDVQNAFGIDAEARLSVVDNANLSTYGEAVSIEIRALDDHLEHPLSDTSSIRIVFTENNSPVVTDDVFQIIENSPIQSFVGIVSANDPDYSQSLSYEIIDGNVDGAFEIGQLTGIITTTSDTALNYEVLNSYSLTIKVSDDAEETLSSYCEIQVIVDDANDQPILELNDLFLSDTLTQTYILDTIQGVDEDAFQSLSYSILSGNSDQIFSLDPVSGELSIVKYESVNYEETSMYNLMILATDNGLNPLSSYSMLTILVVPIDTVIVFSSENSASLSEESAEGFEFFTFTSSIQGNQEGIAYTILSGNEVGAYSLDAMTGVLSVMQADILDYESNSTDELLIHAEYSGSSFASSIDTIFTVYITDSNEKPGIDDLNLSLSEGTEKDELIGQLVASDQDANDKLEFSISSGNSDGIFAIDKLTGELSLAKVLPESYIISEYNLEIRVNDLAGLSSTGLVTIEVLEVNYPPVANDFVYYMDENPVSGFELDTLDAFDPDTEQSIKYSILPGLDTCILVDENTGIITIQDTAIFDFESTGEYLFRYIAEDNSGELLKDTANGRIVLIDVNESPQLQYMDTLEIPEDALVGMQVAMLLAEDPDANDNLEYSFVPGENNVSFALDGGTGEITLAQTLQPHDSIGSYRLRVQVRDSGGLIDTSALIINIYPVNHAPIVYDFSAEVDENPGNAFVLGAVNAIDQDEDQTLYFSLITEANIGISIDENTGIISVDNSELFNYELASEYHFEIAVRDNYEPALSDTAKGVIFINDINEKPDSPDRQTYELDENTSEGEFVGKIQVEDPDLYQTLSYFNAGGNTGGAFEINASTGAIYVDNAQALDYEKNPIFNIQVIIEDNGLGNLKDTTEVVIELRDMQEAPTDILISNTKVSEFIEPGTIVASLLALDEDANDEVVFSFTEVIGVENDNEKFNLTDGVLRTSEILDYETQSVLNIYVRAEDQGSNSIEKAFELQVIDEEETNVINLSDAGLSLYPNPTRGLVYLENLNTESVVGTIRIYNFLGEEVAIKNYNFDKILEIDFSEFQYGVYLLKIQTDGKIIMHSVVKQ